jgi:Ricin-type beta-trefoil lectin domain.
MKRIFIVILCILLLLAVVPFVFRYIKDIRKKLSYTNAYAILNVQTGMAIRVQDANYHDNARTILYPHHNWECITWEMIRLEGNNYLLKNLYTEKTFQPMEAPKAGVGLWQKPLGGTPLQYWEFLKLADGSYLIRLKGTELYITISAETENSPLVLMPKDNSAKQRWMLSRQSPWI